MKIRKYKNSDFDSVRMVGYDTYRDFCSKDGTKKGVRNYLSHFTENLEKLKRVFSNRICYVAEGDDKIVGYISGNLKKVGNLYVLGNYHKKGIAKKLYDKFERDFLKKGGKSMHIKASLYAVPFYEKMGFRKSTGVRFNQKFELKYQPMKKSF